WFRKINYEYIYTKRQTGSTPPPLDNSRGGPGGWDNYYNHFLYSEGWTYEGFTIGNPLLSSHFVNGLGAGVWAVSNNRIVAHHIGLESYINETYHSILKITYSRNYGIYHERYYAHEAGEKYIFDGGLRQISLGWTLSQTLHYDYPIEMQY